MAGFGPVQGPRACFSPPAQVLLQTQRPHLSPLTLWLLLSTCATRQSVLSAAARMLF